MRSPKDFGDLVRRKRQLLGLTQAELGQRAGLETKQISRIETAANVPGLNSVLAICAALNLELSLQDMDQTTAAARRTSSIQDIF